MGREKLLEKLAKLKNAAQGEEAVGNTAAAELFAAKFQQMLLEHDLKASDVEFAAERREQPVGEHRIDYEKYPDIKLKRARVQWQEDLAFIIAKAHFCDILVYKQSSRITLVGSKDHCEVAEYMIMTLTRMADELANREYSIFSTQCVKECVYCGREKKACQCSQYGGKFKPNWAKCRGFRPSFLLAFVNTLNRRFSEQKRQATSSSTALVRVNSMEHAVKSYIEEKYKGKTATALSNNSSMNVYGIKAGRQRANEVNLQANAMKTTERKAIK